MLRDEIGIHPSLNSLTFRPHLNTKLSNEFDKLIDWGKLRTLCLSFWGWESEQIKYFTSRVPNVQDLEIAIPETTDKYFQALCSFTNSIHALERFKVVTSLPFCVWPTLSSRVIKKHFDTLVEINFGEGDSDALEGHVGSAYLMLSIGKSSRHPNSGITTAVLPGFI